MDFTDQVAVVTGGERGIGRAAVEGLAQRGGRVLLLLPVGQGAAATLAACAGLAGEVVVAEVDMLDQRSLNAAVDQGLARWGRIDILITAAAATNDGPVEDLSIEQWRAVVRANLTGTYLACRAVLRPMMKMRYGRIVTVSALQALAGALKQANFAAAMGGVVGFTRSLARDVAAWGITANNVAPGLIQLEDGTNFPAEVVEWSTRIITLRRLGLPAEVAHAILFLASRQASYITGETLSVDGGWRMT